MEYFIKQLELLRNYYMNNGNNKHYAYSKAIQSIKELGYEESVERLNNNEKIPFVGNSTISKWIEYKTNGYFNKLVELNIKFQKPSKKKTVVNEHKHYISRAKVKTICSDIMKCLDLNYSSSLDTDQLKESDGWTLVGSYRRMKEVCGDGDILVYSTNKDRLINYANTIISSLSTKKKYKIVSKGLNKIKLEVLYKGECIFEVDIRFIHKKHIGTALCHMTGSGAENVRLRSLARRKGMKLSEYGIITLTDNVEHHFFSERKVYEFLGQTYKVPKDR